MTESIENEPASKAANELAGRDAIVEILRFCACLMVVLCHFFSAFLPIAAYGPTSPAILSNGCNLGIGLVNSLLFNFLTAGNFGVALFFILSGFVLSKPTFDKPAFSFSSWSGDVAKRFIRLAVPLYAFSFIAFICFVCHIYEHSACAVAHVSGSGWLLSTFGDLDRAKESALLTLSSPFEFSSRLLPPAWTIGLELVGSFLTYGLAAITYNSSAGIFICFLAMVCAPGYLKLFAVGTLFAYAESRGKIRYASFRARAVRNNLLLIILLFFVCIYLDSFPWFVNTQDIRNSAPSYAPLLGLNAWLCKVGVAGGVNSIGAVLSFFAAKVWLIDNELVKKLAWLGKHTYTIYLSHFILVGTVCSWAFLHLVQPGFNQYYTTLSIVLFVLVLSIWLTCIGLTNLIDGNAIKMAKAFKVWYLHTLSPDVEKKSNGTDL